MILAVIVPIFLLLSLGFAAVKSQLLTTEHLNGLSVFVLNIALPALFLQSLAAKEIEEIWHTQYVIAYGSVSFLLYLLVFFVIKNYFKNNFSHSAVLALGGAMSNTGLIGTAVLTLLLGSKALTYTTLTVMVESILLIPLVLALATIGQNPSANVIKIFLGTMLTLLKSPVFLGVFIGLLCAIWQLRLPIYLDQVLLLLGQCASPLALFIIGAGIAGVSFKQLNRQTLFLVVSSNLFMPVCMYMTLKYLTNVSQEMLYVGTLLAALPMPSLYAMLGYSHGLEEETLMPLLISTVIGFISIAVLIMWWWSPSPV